MHNPNENDKKFRDLHGILTHTHGSNTPFKKCFNDKDIPDSTEESKKRYKKFSVND